MDMNLLRVDLDISNKKEAIKQLKERLSYFHDVDFLHIDIIKKIVLLKKSSYCAKIYLNENLKDEKNIIILQLLLGSDYMKEVNTYLNHYKFNMEYSNRMFDCKRYKGGVIKIGKKIDVTKEIKNYVYCKKRKKNFN